MTRRLHSKDAPYISRGTQVDFSKLIFTNIDIALQSGSITCVQDTTDFRDAAGIIPAGSLMHYNSTTKKYGYYDGTLPAVGILGKDTDVYDGDAISFLYVANFGIYSEMIPNAAVNGGLGLLDIGAQVRGHSTFVQGVQNKFYTAEVVTADATLALDRPTILNGSVGTAAHTLGGGSYIGQKKYITMLVDETNAHTVSITNHVTEDPEVATFNAIDEFLEAVWTGTEWDTIRATCTFV
jgi:hypothetical protein